MKNGEITHIDLFSGIGGFALAADRVWPQGGVRHIFCDNDPFCQEVLRKHWPNSTIYSDIRTLTNTESGEQQQLAMERKSDEKISATNKSHFILTGGFPCQPFSQAGRRRGTDDDRYLWPEMLRVIREFSPTWVIAENVRGLLTQGGGVVFERVCTDLESAGYEVQPIVIPAVAVGAPHRRDRVWFIAHATSKRSGGKSRTLRQEKRGQNDESVSERIHPDSDAQNTISERGRGRMENSRQILGRESTEVKDARPSWETHWLEVATRLCRVDDGVPRRMDRNPRLKALGNAIVPQVAEEIMRAIQQCESV